MGRLGGPPRSFFWLSFVAGGFLAGLCPGFPVWWCLVASSSGSSLFAPPALSVLLSAFRAGSLCSFAVCPSARSFSGWVVRVSFFSSPRGGRFARRWAARVGRPLSVRRPAGSGVVAVSVPCSPAPAAAASAVGFRFWLVGGVRGFFALLRSCGFWSPSRSAAGSASPVWALVLAVAVASVLLWGWVAVAVLVAALGGWVGGVARGRRLAAPAAPAAPSSWCALCGFACSGGLCSGCCSALSAAGASGGPVPG